MKNLHAQIEWRPQVFGKSNFAVSINPGTDVVRGFGTHFPVPGEQNNIPMSKANQEGIHKTRRYQDTDSLQVFVFLSYHSLSLLSPTPSPPSCNDSMCSTVQTHKHTKM